MRQLSRRNVLCGLVGPAGVAGAAALLPFVPTGAIEVIPDRYSVVIDHVVTLASGQTFGVVRAMERGELKTYLAHPMGLAVGERISVSAR
jgi:hypothetical protein